MENLLQWGLANSTPESAAAHPPRPTSELDPAIIDHILGKPDAVRMKEALGIAVDETKSEDDRVNALDEFELLIESIDNANDISNLKMWEPLIALIKSPLDQVRMQAIWVLGTAIQNNPKAQTAFLSYNPLPSLLSLLSSSSDSSAQTRSKAVYCISGSLKHSRNAVQAFEVAGGWEGLKGALADSDITIRRKTAFLLNTLLLQDGPEPPSSGITSFPSDVDSRISSHPVSSNPSADSYVTAGLVRNALRSHGILQNLVDSLVSPVPSGPDGDQDGDADYEEKAIRALLTYAELENDGPWNGIGSSSLSSLVKLGDANSNTQSGPWGLTRGEWDSFKKSTSS